MSHYSAFLRSYHTKTTKTSGTTSTINNETDENSSIKNLILKHVAKGQQASNNVQTAKGTIRGILGEVGNTNLTTKSLINKPKIVQQKNSIETIIECQSIISVPPPAPPPSTSSNAIVVPLFASTNNSTAVVINQIEEIVLDDEIPSSSDIPAEFDCDSADYLNITTASEYVVDICKYWRELEQQTLIRPNFLSNRPEGKKKNERFDRSFVRFRHSLTAKSSCFNRLVISSS